MAVTAAGVSVKFGSGMREVTACDDVSIVLNPGEFHVVYGPSGSGKSTLIRVLGGILSPDSGQVSFDGKKISTSSELERSQWRLSTVGVVFQDHNLIAEFTASENVELPLRLRGMSSKESKAEAQRWLDRVGLAGLSGRFPDELSGGQQQRVGIARALAGDRQVLLADEPTGSLDSKNSEEIFELLMTVSREQVACFVVTHDPIAEQYADHVHRMLDGRLSS